MGLESSLTFLHIVTLTLPVYVYACKKYTVICV